MTSLADSELPVASCQLSVVSKCYLIITLQGLKARRTLCITRTAEARALLRWRKQDCRKGAESILSKAKARG